MATNKLSRGSAGGGYGSRQHVNKPVRYGNAAKGPTPGRVSQWGNMTGDHVTHKGSSTGYKGEPHFGNAPVNSNQKLGNEVALRQLADREAVAKSCVPEAKALTALLLVTLQLKAAPRIFWVLMDRISIF
jgi:hypothetical protein